MNKLLLALLLSAAPAAAQTIGRAPLTGLTVIPGLGAASQLLPTLAPALSPLAAPSLTPIPALTPSLVRPALAAGMLPAAAKPAEASPLDVIGDASAGAAQKTAALERLFENSAPSSPEALDMTALLPAPIQDVPGIPKGFSGQSPDEQKAVFNTTFADFGPVENRSMVRRQHYRGSSGRGDEKRSQAQSYDDRIDEHRDLTTLTDEPIALLVKSEDSQRLKLVIGKVIPHSEPISYTMTRRAPMRSGNGDIFAMMSDLTAQDDTTTLTGHGLTRLDIKTAAGAIVNVPMGDVVMRTGSLRDRRGIFNRVFKAFDPKEIRLKGKKDFLKSKDEDILTSARADHERFKKIGEDAPVALLVKNDDGSMRIVVGAQMPVIELIARKFDTEKKDVLTALIVTAPNGTFQRVPIESVVAYTQLPLATARDQERIAQERAVGKLVTRIPDAVLFDWDDTLADEQPIVRATHEELFRRFGLKMPSHETLENQWRADHAVFYARFFPGIPTEAIEDVWHEITEQLRRGEEINGKRVERAAMFAGTVEILEALKALNVPMAVVSNKREEGLLREIEASGLGHYFKHVYGHMDGRQRKPSPQSVESTLQTLGVAPGNAWYIGDQLSDMAASTGLLRILVGRETAKMARELGMHTERAGAVVFIDALRDLIPLLQKLPRKSTH